MLRYSIYDWEMTLNIPNINIMINFEQREERGWHLREGQLQAPKLEGRR